MVIAAFFDGAHLHVEFLNKGGQLFIPQIFEDEFVRLEDGQFIVVDIDHFLCVFDDGGCVGSQEMFTLADADHQGAAFSRGDDGIGMFLVQQHDDVCADDPFERDPDGFFQTAIVVLLDVLDEIQQYFGVGVAFELVSFFGKFGLELGIVLDDAVMDHGQPAACGALGMGIPVIGFSMGGPARMPHARMSVKILSDQAFFEIGYLPFFLIDSQVIVQQGHAGAVITAVFKTLQPLQYKGIGFTGTNISNDSAHRRRVFVVFGWAIL
jgi:hypothetical protein